MKWTEEAASAGGFPSTTMTSPVSGASSGGSAASGGASSSSSGGSAGGPASAWAHPSAGYDSATNESIAAAHLESAAPPRGGRAFIESS